MAELYSYFRAIDNIMLPDSQVFSVVNVIPNKVH